MTISSEMLMIYTILSHSNNLQKLEETIMSSLRMDLTTTKMMTRGLLGNFKSYISNRSLIKISKNKIQKVNGKKLQDQKMSFLHNKIIIKKRGEGKAEVDLMRDIVGELIALILMIHIILLLKIEDQPSIMIMIPFSKKSQRGKESKLQHQEKKMWQNVPPVTKVHSVYNFQLEPPENKNDTSEMNHLSVSMSMLRILQQLFLQKRLNPHLAMQEMNKHWRK